MAASEGETVDDVIIVSVDGHAQMPPELWADYLESDYHDLLPGLRDEQEVYGSVLEMVFQRAYRDPEIFDRDGAIAADRWTGLYDVDVRLAEMDREGTAAEFINSGDGRITSLFFETGNRVQSVDAGRAGVRAYHRWLHDTLGPHPERLLLVGTTGSGPCLDLDPVLDELDWIADRGFRATAIPGKTTYAGDPPLYDPHWEPFWQRCDERGLALWIHNGHGHPQAALWDELDMAYAKFVEVDRDYDRFWEIIVAGVLNGALLDSVKPRQAMWHLMLGGVFDRHPDLTLMMNEVRGDWLPATLEHLDRVWTEHRDEIPAKRLPSEYWASNCQVGLSFIHKSEVERRDELGIDTVSFGRDYPHSEGTWPNTLEWLRDAFAGIPEPEVRAILGENAIRTFDLDRDALARIASRIGPSIDDITGAQPVDPALLEHFQDRGGYLKPFEGDRRIPEIDALVQADLVDLVHRSGATTS